MSTWLTRPKRGARATAVLSRGSLAAGEDKDGQKREGRGEQTGIGDRRTEEALGTADGVSWAWRESSGLPGWLEGLGGGDGGGSRLLEVEENDTFLTVSSHLRRLHGLQWPEGYLL